MAAMRKRSASASVSKYSGGNVFGGTYARWNGLSANSISTAQLLGGRLTPKKSHSSRESMIEIGCV